MLNLKNFVCFLTICFCVEGGCPPGWMAHGTSCYHFSHDTEEWIGALNICRELGGQLVEIEDAAEDKYILSQARIFDKSYWTALSDIQEEGTWVWMNSKTPLAVDSYTDWAPKQPDNDDGDENCINLEPNFNMLWNDLACHTNINYICEKSNNEVDIIG